MADAGSVNLGSAYGDIQIDLGQVEQQLNKAFQAIEQKAGNAFQRLGSGMQQTGDRLASIGSGMMTLTSPVAALGAVGVRAFGKLDDAMAEIRARTGATETQMDAVRQMAIKMGQETAFSATDAANAMLQLLASGYDIEQSFSALPAVLDAAAAGGLDLGYTADVVTDALAMWNLEATEANRVSDTLARGAAASSAEINDLAQGLGNVGPIAAQFGLSIEDTVAILSAFSERGIKGAEAGTALKSMLTNMTRPTEKVQKAWTNLGVSLFDATGAVRPLNTVLAELRPKLAAMSDQERIETIQTLAGSYGQLGLSVLTSSDAMGDMAALMTQQADASTVARARLDSLNGSISQASSSLQTALIVAMTDLIERSIKPAIQGITQLLNRLTAWMQANPELTNQIVRVLAIVTAIGPALFTAGKALGAIGGLITSLATPIGVVVLAVGALAAAWESNLGGIQDITKKVLGPVIDTVTYIAHWLGEAFKANADEGGFFAGLLGAFEALFYVFQDGETTFFSKFFESLGLGSAVAKRLGMAIVNLKNTVSGAFSAIATVVRDNLTGEFRRLGDALRSGDIGGILSGLKDLGVSIVNIIMSYMPEDVVRIFDGLMNVVSAAMSVLSNGFLPLIISVIDTLVQAWKIVSPSLMSLADWFIGSALPAILDFLADDVIPLYEDYISLIGGIWEAVKPALLDLFDWFVNTGLPAIVDFIKDPTIPTIEDVLDALKDIWRDARPFLTNLYNWFVNVALPAILRYVTTNAIPGIKDLIATLKNIWDQVQPKLQSLYNWVMVNALPAIMASWASFRDNVIKPLITTLKNVWDEAGPKLQEFYNWVVDNLGTLKTKVFDPIANAIQDVIDTINRLTGPLAAIGEAVPDWLKPGSPTPFELGLRGIKRAIDDVANADLAASLAVNASAASMPGAATGPAARDGDTYNVTIQLPEGVNPQQAREIGAAAGDSFAKQVRSRTRWAGGGIEHG